jgi:transcriptional regulator with XRE-family HTH domain
MSNRIYRLVNETSFKLAKQMSRIGNAQGLTVHKLAEESEVSETTIRAILNTNIKPRNPRLDTIVKIARGLKTPLNTFMDLTNVRI